MDDVTTQALANLSNILLQNSYDWVNTKRAQARNNKDAKEQSRVYEEIIDDLLREQSDLRDAARTYKELYEQVSIKDEDIKYLRDTVRRVIQLFINVESEEKDKQNIEALIELIDKDTLKTMQLLGFNYKDAIGKPLTDVCATLIYQNLGRVQPYNFTEGN